MGKLDVSTILKMTTGGIAGICTLLFGEADKWLIALIVFLVTDYITGVAAAYITKELSSKAGMKGIVKKVMFLAVVAVAHIIDSVMGLSGIVRDIVIGFLAANEGLSILENCARCGLPVPPKLIDTLKQLKEKSQGDSKDTKE